MRFWEWGDLLEQHEEDDPEYPPEMQNTSGKKRLKLPVEAA
jgi:hypothetical protein